MSRTPKANILLLACAIALPLFMLGGLFSNIFGLSLAVLIAFLVLGALAGFSKGTLIAIGCATLFYCVNDLPLGLIGRLFSVIGVLCTVGIIIAFGKYLYLLTLPIGYGIALLICGNPILALGTLVFLPPAFVLGIMVKKGCRQSNIILGTTACFVLLFAGALAAWLYTKSGTLSLDYLTNVIKETRELFISEMLLAFEETGIAMTEDILREASSLTIGLLPAMLILIFELAVYPAVRTTTGTCHRLGEKKPSPSTMVLRLETVSAILFLAAIVLMLFADGVFMLVLGNLILLLLPAFALVEIISIVAQIRLGIMPLSPFFIILILCFAGSLLPMLLALLGAIHTITANRTRNR